MNPDPFSRFHAWLADARSHPGIKEPTAMCLATATGAGVPSARIVLLKGCDERGFTFFSNAESRKGDELRENAHVALCFYWMPQNRQVRVEGVAEPVSTAEADAYFATRARESRIGAWASQQSRPLPSRETLIRNVEHHSAVFEGKDVPRPPYWSGWRVVPRVIEFWEEAPHRLHNRDVYKYTNQGSWELSHLYP